MPVLVGSNVNPSGEEVRSKVYVVTTPPSVEVEIGGGGGTVGSATPAALEREVAAAVAVAGAVAVAVAVELTDELAVELEAELEAELAVELAVELAPAPVLDAPLWFVHVDFRLASHPLNSGVATSGPGAGIGGSEQLGLVWPINSQFVHLFLTGALALELELPPPLLPPSFAELAGCTHGPHQLEIGGRLTQVWRPCLRAQQEGRETPQSQK